MIFDGFFVTTTPGASTGGDALDQAASGTLPTGWARWASTPAGEFRTAAGGIGGTNALVSDGESYATARAWLTTAGPANAEVQGAVYLGSLAPAQLFLRGSNLGGM